MHKSWLTALCKQLHSSLEEHSGIQHFTTSHCLLDDTSCFVFTAARSLHCCCCCSTAVVDHGDGALSCFVAGLSAAAACHSFQQTLYHNILSALLNECCQSLPCTIARKSSSVMAPSPSVSNSLIMSCSSSGSMSHCSCLAISVNSFIVILPVWFKSNS